MVVKLVENNSPTSEITGLQKSSEFNQYNTNLFKYNTKKYHIVAGKLISLNQLDHQPATGFWELCLKQYNGNNSPYSNFLSVNANNTEHKKEAQVHLLSYSSVRTKILTGLNISFVSDSYAG